MLMYNICIADLSDVTFNNIPTLFIYLLSIKTCIDINTEPLSQ